VKNIRNQTLLLNHVNDHYKTLAEIFRRMLWVGVHPYYLLQCHKEKGIVHFITPVQVGKIYMKHLQGWISGITFPSYDANIEGGGGKVWLMQSGHNTLNSGMDIEEKISESCATENTWNGKELMHYEALGSASRREYDHTLQVMEKFTGRKGVFVPRIIIVDQDGKHIGTTNRTKLPKFEKLKKSKLLEYRLYKGNMSLTNPADRKAELEKLFMHSKYHRVNRKLLESNSVTYS
jgi:lysine 2,3-aminomutase